MTMQQTPEAPFMPPHEPATRDRAVQRYVKWGLDIRQKVLDQLDTSHSGWFEIPDKQRAAAYSLMPTQQQMDACIGLVSPTPDPETLQMVPSPYASLVPLVEAIPVSPNPFAAWLLVLGHIRPDKAEQIARDARRLGHRIEAGKL